MEINSIEISPSNRAICIFCKNKIGMGVPRGVVVTSNKSYGDSESFVCYKCSLKEIDLSIEHKIFLKKQLENLIKEKSKEIIAEELCYAQNVKK